MTYIGLPVPAQGLLGIFGNPIRPGQSCPICGKFHSRQDYQPCYTTYLKARLSSDPLNVEWAERIAKQARLEIPYRLDAWLIGLVGESLSCPDCGDNDPLCHGRVLERAAKWSLSQQLCESCKTSKAVHYLEGHLLCESCREMLEEVWE